MRQIRFDEGKISYQGRSIRKRYEEIWAKNFTNETSKFISPTLLKPEDLKKEFLDEKGEAWIILGQTEQSRELACEKVSTQEIFLWDRWKVSTLVRPTEHTNATTTKEYIYPSTKKTRKKKDPADSIPLQLDLFSSSDLQKDVKIVSAIYGSEEKTVNVTTKILSLFLKKENIKVSNQLGGDPHPGTPKKLTISYICEGETITKSFSEKSIVKF